MVFPGFGANIGSTIYIKTLFGLKIRLRRCARRKVSRKIWKFARSICCHTTGSIWRFWRTKSRALAITLLNFGRVYREKFFIILTKKDWIFHTKMPLETFLKSEIY